jgi:hypothetical protein
VMTLLIARNPRIMGRLVRRAGWPRLAQAATLVMSVAGWRFWPARRPSPLAARSSPAPHPAPVR